MVTRGRVLGRRALDTMLAATETTVGQTPPPARLERAADPCRCLLPGHRVCAGRVLVI
uniref:hypothetical protein n=1 Tax=Nonomuraea sp. CA-252377 TaxID=3240003 RepID=UPI003F492206